MRARQHRVDRSPWSDVAIVAATVAATIVVLAPTAGALSRIDNRFSIDPASFCGGQGIDLRANVTFGWVYDPNPYTSNYRMAVRYRHFIRPTTYNDNTEGTNWYYMAADPWMDLDYDPPTYRWDSGTFFVIPTEHRHTYASTRARYAYEGAHGGWLRNKLHQYSSSTSKGAIVYVYSHHC